MNNDIKILRRLAAEYLVIANEDKNYAEIPLHKGVNDIKMIRPIALIDEIPWHDFDIPLECSDEDFRGVEWFFKSELFRHEHFSGDRFYVPYLPVSKCMYISGYGISAEGEHIDGRGGAVGSILYADQLPDEEALNRLKTPEVTYDKEKTYARYSKICEAVGDIIPVKLVGMETGYGLGYKIWDDVSTLMGVEDLLMNLAMRPDFMHQVAEKFTDMTVSVFNQAKDLKLLDSSAVYCHSTAALTNDLKKPDDFDNVGFEHVWGRGLAQIFASVSPSMQEEFDTVYAKRALEPFGLVYYGCCEPLHNKIDILRSIKNLRKISITPWADVDIAADAIGTDYVLSVKLNPSMVAGKLDEAALRSELDRIFAACRRNNCAFELVLKDISTVSRNVNNLTRWSEIVGEYCRNY